MEPIIVNGSFTIENVGSLQEQMRAALANGTASQSIEIDLAQVSEFDGAGMQLLLAFQHAVSSAGAQLNLINMTEVVAASLQRFDVAQRFGNQELL
ncbi:anti-sigma B factor antagonist [Oxalobacteraceae bacterium GrIS 2.11]